MFLQNTPAEFEIKDARATTKRTQNPYFRERFISLSSLPTLKSHSNLKLKSDPNK